MKNLFESDMPIVRDKAAQVKQKDRQDVQRNIQIEKILIRRKRSKRMWHQRKRRKRKVADIELDDIFNS
jgi:hypothetical protein